MHYATWKLELVSDILRMIAGINLPLLHELEPKKMGIQGLF